jgi:membrane-associated phospholipid phosphatase
MILNHREANARSLMTDLDVQIPFIPGFIIPYLLWYPLILGSLIIFCMRDRKVYYRTLVALCVGLIISYLFYFFFQTTVPRPSIAPDSFLNTLVWFVYQTDQPYNCFPSIHVLTSYLIIKGIMDCSNLPKALRYIVAFSSWAVIVSTVFVKQHVVLDVFGGVILAQFLYHIVGKYMERQAILKLSRRKWMHDL